MAENRLVARLDQKLMESGIVDPTLEKEYKKVHDMLNKNVRKTGKVLADENFKKGEQALRAWLMLLYKKGATQEKLTSYLRCGLAHLSFDYIESTYEQISIDELITRSMQSFRKRNYHNSFFRVSASEIEKLKAKKREARKKAGNKTSSAKAKTAKKKAVKKKAVKKKTAAKKAVKRKSAKKAVNKATVKKTAKAVKKTSAKKMPAKKKSSAKKASKKAAPKNSKKKTEKKQKDGLLSRFLNKKS